MRPLKILAILGAITVTSMAAATKAEASYYRSYYGGWSYYPQRTYYYTYYYYKPTPTYRYSYHYSIYYPSRPRYVYYYNPVRRVYWGRYDMETKGYSLLAEADRKEKLEDIAESAFPAPGEMPAIPESTDGEKMLPPPAPPKT